jgi:hypothetical protein
MGSQIKQNIIHMPQPEHASFHASAHLLSEHTHSDFKQAFHILVQALLIYIYRQNQHHGFSIMILSSTTFQALIQFTQYSVILSIFRKVHEEAKWLKLTEYNIFSVHLQISKPIQNMHSSHCSLSINFL